MTDIGEYLSGVTLPKRSLDSRQFLDQPLMLEELEQALQQTPNEKAPDSDGLPGEFYKIYSKNLLP